MSEPKQPPSDPAGTPTSPAAPAAPAARTPASAAGSVPPASAGLAPAERAATDNPASASTVETVHPSTSVNPPFAVPPETVETAARPSIQSSPQPSAEAAAQQSFPTYSTVPDFGVSANAPPPEPSAAPPAYLKQSDSAWSVLGRILAARARSIFDRAGQRITQRTLKIGVSARIFHPEPGAKGLRGKTLQYLEESVAHWVMSRDVLVFMIPTVGNQGRLHPSNIRLRDYAKLLDGLVLQGGADVSPQSYAEAATRPEWPGDRVRDMYELELLHEFIESGKPVLGVCRGCQLINVAFGGTLYQDIATDVPTASVHVNDDYDQHRHAIRFPAGSTLASMFAGQSDALVNSIHHQAVKTIGRDLNVEAVSAADGIIEAVRYRKAPFVMGVQWHPEFHRAGGPELLDCTPILDTFLRVARETRF